MNSNDDMSVVDLVRDVKTAILEAQDRLDERGITISRVDLEVMTAFVTSAGGEIGLKIIPIELSGQYSRSQMNTIHLSLTPLVPEQVERISELGSELVRAIEVISTAAHEAPATKPEFLLDHAEVILQFATDVSGHIRLFAGAGQEAGWAHLIRMTLLTR
ncbi:trypco2 family protein [Methanofollis fontis]|uniref:Trypsin-co-occurring domain-containing protein n=1 Tax=Methanofollis fontis TaxID=2052832 RepID=A0A483CT26_9EURY|nr:trypco2 family protein [Methanofollis fontis]TAJ43814.1 hypothetical protein CUJ86_07030 [Methanofollis fontis]